METMDQSETRLETCDMVTFDLTSCISSETDPVCTVSTGDKASAPPPLPDSISVSEPGSIQEGKALSSMTPNLTVPEPASQTRMGHLPKPKPDLGRASRTMQREPAEGVTSSAEIFSDPVKADVPSTTAESQISRVNEAPSEPEPEEQKSELCEGRENGKTESCTSVLSGVEKTEHGESEKRTCIEEEKKEEMLQTHRYTRKDLYFVLAFHDGIDGETDQSLNEHYTQKKVRNPYCDVISIGHTPKSTCPPLSWKTSATKGPVFA